MWKEKQCICVLLKQTGTAEKKIKDEDEDQG